MTLGNSGLSLSSPATTPSPTTGSPITDPFCHNILLSEFLQLIWCYNKTRNLDNGLVIDSILGKKVFLLDPRGEHCHIEFPTDRPNVCHLYEIKDWRNSIEKEIKKRRQADFDRKDKFHKQECVELIAAKLMENETVGMLPLEFRMTIARRIVEANDGGVLAKSYGIDSVVYTGKLDY